MVITGTATYRERIALPANAIFRATLEDASRADAASTVLAQAEVKAPQVPVAFTIAVESRRIEPRRRYVVRARITVDDQLLFTTDMAYPVLGDGATHVDLMLRRVVNSRAPAASLEGTYWKLANLRGRPVEVLDRQREPHFILHPAQANVSGSGGCNRLAGSYRLEGDRLTFGRTVGTMMACLQGMAQERTFLEALAVAARWRIEGERLTLMDAQGEVVAEFDSVYLR